MTITSMISRLLAAAALLPAIATVATPRADAQPTAPPEFVSLADVDPTILRDIRYFTPHNFTGDPSPAIMPPMAKATWCSAPTT